jgi:hypothetical protein
VLKRFYNHTVVELGCVRSFSSTPGLAPLQRLGPGPIPKRFPLDLHYSRWGLTTYRHRAPASLVFSFPATNLQNPHPVSRSNPYVEKRNGTTSRFNHRK